MTHVDTPLCALDSVFNREPLMPTMMSQKEEEEEEEEEKEEELSIIVSVSSQNHIGNNSMSAMLPRATKRN